MPEQAVPGSSEHAWPLPAPVPSGPRPRSRRSARDWVVDVTCFLLAVASGLVLVGITVSEPDPPAAVLVFADIAVGGAATLALWWRREWPVAVALLLAVIGCFSEMVAPAALIALFTVAVHRRPTVVLAVAAANLAGSAVFALLRPAEDLSFVWVVVFGVLVTAAVVAWGMAIRARRELVVSLRERAVRAESEQLLRVEQARHTERTRIAREMHDVLAHRLSLLSMHAGALEFRPDAPPAEVAAAAGVVRASARQALEDLREVIGVLRESPDEGGQTRPQPGLADVPALVEESREAGLRVRAEYGVADLGAAPSVTGRTAYRVVQEALTNVRKHAPGSVATVAVTGGPGTGLTVDVRNPARTGGVHADALPGAGTGLIGLLERVTLAGGGLAHGWTADGEFRLTATLPWPA
ncbi:sensor histidine kinase [Modestobacter muralis]|uniref:histidine kinase n=1 Tax=Modestobacter muralis TaxID=1608614 RepID=A0A6P0EUT6_9ACTN|nr:histidine kinase [Modestobacter muralis]NEK95392.1 sensor histidine kinase [Modestobacter muralis]NEN52280.1 sensor histidine kinase [Modestobacter muralis]